MITEEEKQRLLKKWEPILNGKPSTDLSKVILIEPFECWPFTNKVDVSDNLREKE